MPAKINHIAIASDQYAINAKFYEALFGMKTGTKPRPARAVAIKDGYLGLNIIPRREGRASGLDHFGIEVDDIPFAFNVFMHVDVDSASGVIRVLPPKSGPGDYVRLRALMPMIVGMTACSAGQSNNFRYKPIDYRIIRAPEADA